MRPRPYLPLAFQGWKALARCDSRLLRAKSMRALPEGRLRDVARGDTGGRRICHEMRCRDLPAKWYRTKKEEIERLTRIQESIDQTQPHKRLPDTAIDVFLTTLEKHWFIAFVGITFLFVGFKFLLEKADEKDHRERSQPTDVPPKVGVTRKIILHDADHKLIAAFTSAVAGYVVPPMDVIFWSDQVYIFDTINENSVTYVQARPFALAEGQTAERLTPEETERWCGFPKK
jgi:hypothetical protein